MTVGDTTNAQPTVDPGKEVIVYSALPQTVTAANARQLDGIIRAAPGVHAVAVYLMHRDEGWRHLGLSSFKAYAETLDCDESTLYRLAEQGEVIETLVKATGRLEFLTEVSQRAAHQLAATPDYVAQVTERLAQQGTPRWALDDLRSASNLQLTDDEDAEQIDEEAIILRLVAPEPQGTPAVGRDDGTRSRGHKPRKGPKNPSLRFGVVEVLAVSDPKELVVRVREEEVEEAVAVWEQARGVVNEGLEFLYDRITKRPGTEYPPRGGPQYQRRPSTDPVAETVSRASGKLVKDALGKAVVIEPEPRIGQPAAGLSVADYINSYPTEVRELRQLARENGLKVTRSMSKRDIATMLDDAGVNVPAVLGLGEK